MLACFRVLNITDMVNSQIIFINLHVRHVFHVRLIFVVEEGALSTETTMK